MRKLKVGDLVKVNPRNPTGLDPIDQYHYVSRVEDESNWFNSNPEHASSIVFIDYKPDDSQYWDEEKGFGPYTEEDLEYCPWADTELYQVLTGDKDDK